MKFIEEEHPRDNDGKFTEKGNSKEGLAKEVSEFKPDRFEGLKGEVDRYNKDNSNKYITKQLEYKDSKTKQTFQIMDMTGMSLKEAEETRGVIDKFTRASFKRIRENPDCKEAKIIENFIEKHPKLKGSVYRGVALSEEDGKRFIEDYKTKSEMKLICWEYLLGVAKKI